MRPRTPLDSYRYFKNSRITTITRYSEAGFETHQRPQGRHDLAFELAASFTALNGGPAFKFNEAVRLKCTARRRTRSTTTGRSSLQEAIPKRSSAAG